MGLEPLAPLRTPAFRRLAASTLVAATSLWSFRILQTWLVLKLSHGSAFMVGLTAGCQFLPVLIVGLFGGPIADRFRKSRTIATADLSIGLIGLAMCTTVAFGIATPWMVASMALAVGAASALSQAARQTFPADIVEQGQLIGAISLISALVGVGRILGPVQAGVLLAVSSMVVALAATAIMLIAASIIVFISFLSQPNRSAPVGHSKMTMGVDYVRSRPDLAVVLLLLAVVGSFAWNSQILIALVADNVFAADAAEYAALASLFAAGGFLGTVHMAWAPPPTAPSMARYIITLATLTSMAGFAPSLGWFAVAMVPLGFSALQVSVATNVVFVSTVPVPLRGRVMAVYLVVTNGSIAIGGPALGLIAEFAGARAAYILAGGVVLAALLIVATVVGSDERLRNMVWFRPRESDGWNFQVDRTEQGPC